MHFDRSKYENLTLEEKVDEALSLLANISYAFPDGTEAHRNAHLAMIRASEAQERFWNELKLDLAKKGVVAIVVVLVGLMVTGMAVKLGVLAAFSR